VEVTTLPYELHPEIPAEGISMRDRWAARYAEAEQMYARIEAECRVAGLPFRRPERIPNTRRALETAEYVRRRHPAAFEPLERALFAAHFAEGRFLGDPAVLDDLVAAGGVDAAEVQEALGAGALGGAVDQSMAAASDAGVTATPTWLIDERVLIPGAQPRETIERAVARWRERTGG
jgi:predicted DsbA family dithiol-disulfide isomerase